MKRLALALLTLSVLWGCTPKSAQQSGTVRHMIMWTLDDSLDVNQKEEIIKASLEDFYSLSGKIPGIVSMKAIYDGRLPSSNCDFMYDMVFESEDALKGFSENPEHLKCAGKLKPYIKSRTCLDVLN